MKLTRAAALSAVGGLRRVIEILVSVALLAPSSALQASAAEVQERIAVLADDGAWTWLNDPRAVFHNGVLYFGFVRNTDARSVLRAFDPRSGVGTNLWLSSFSERDDFNAPAVLVRRDGRMIGAFSRHGVDPFFYFRISRSDHPTNAALWGPEQRSVATGNPVHYANLFELPGEPARLVNMVRNEGSNPTLFVSPDSGQHWEKSRMFLQTAPASLRPYLKLVASSNRVDFVYSEGHPREMRASLYHVYLADGVIRKSTGEVLKSWADLPILQGANELGSVVYPYSDEVQGNVHESVPDGRPWVWEVAHDSEGHPVCVFSVSRPDSADWSAARIAYFYARWTGTNWLRRFIAHAGRPLYASEQQYAAGICLDPSDPNVVYLASNSEDPFTRQPLEEVSLRRDERYELWRGETRDGGQSFNWQPVTSDSAVDNIRPYVPSGSNVVLWLRGRYWSYTSFRCEVVGLFPQPLPRVPDVVVQWEVLTNAAQVRMLGPVEAARNFPVHLRGTVVADPQAGGDSCVILDDSAGIYLQGSSSTLANLQRGDAVEVEGVTSPGEFAPIVQVRSLKRLGRMEIPPPKPSTFEDLINGELDSQWVEVSGIVRSCSTLVPDRKYQLEVATGGGRLLVHIIGRFNPEALIDAEVRLPGVVFSLFNKSRQVISPLLVVPNGASFTVEKAAPANPYATPILNSANLLQFAPQGTYGHRVHVRGIVLHHVPGEMLWIRDESGGLRVQCGQTNRLRPGIHVDVLGFPSRGDYSPVLEDAVFRTLSVGAHPDPVALTQAEAALNHDADLIQIDAVIGGKQATADGWAVVMQSGDASFRALLRMGPQVKIPDEWQPRSRVTVTGISSVTVDKSRATGVAEPRSFELLLRSMNDVALVQPPPWWTRERVVWMLVIVASGLLLVVWLVVWAARRRLREQALQRAMAEGQFSAILNERNRMAREIHDTLAQGLSAISMQLEVTKSRLPQVARGAAESLEQAHHLVRSSLAEARNSIWNMRSQVLESNDLGSALRQILDQMTSGTSIQGTVRTVGRPRRLPPVTENNLLRIGQEAITNAIAHADAARIDVELEFREKEIGLRIADDGSGFDTSHPPPSDSGFGLIGMRERVAELHGALEILSTPGRGTEVKLVVPVAG